MSFSQTTDSLSIDTNTVSLKPDTVLVDSMGVPTHFAWRIDDQVPALATHIVRSEASLIIEAQQDTALFRCDSIITTQNVKIQSLEIQVDNRQEKVDNQSIQIKGLEGTVTKQRKQIKFLNIKVVVFPTVAGVGGFFLGKLIFQ